MATTTEKPASALDASGAAAVEGLMKVLEALTTQLATLNQRLDRLQTAGLSIAGMTPAPAAEATALAAAPVPAPAALAAEEESNEDLLLAISAAVAAYLGKRPRIRAIRLLDDGDWAQQGRVFVQASHTLNLARDF
jgi:methylmalonyl-CoA carboxyltransferase large subunit